MRKSVVAVIFALITGFLGLIIYHGQSRPPVPVLANQGGYVDLGLGGGTVAEPLPEQTTDYCYLLLISTSTYRPGVNNIGDVVGVFPANQPFTHGEKTGFTIIKVTGLNREQEEAELEKLLPNTVGWTEKKIESDLTKSKYRFNVQIDKYENIIAITSNIKVKTK